MFTVRLILIVYFSDVFFQTILYFFSPLLVRAWCGRGWLHQGCFIYLYLQNNTGYGSSLLLGLYSVSRMNTKVAIEM
jgi:hypothetical protein